MTIARRILFLAALTPLVLVALGALNQFELVRVDEHSRFVVEKQVPSISSLGNVSRTFEEMRVALRDHVLATDPAGQGRSREQFVERQAELAGLLRQYADGLVSDERDRRLAPEIEALGVGAVVAPTMMSSREAEVALARHVLEAIA